MRCSTRQELEISEVECFCEDCRSLSPADLQDAHEHHHGHDAEPAEANLPVFGKLAKYSPVTGILLVALGFALDVAGYAGSWWLFAAAALVSGLPVARSGLGTLLRHRRADTNLLTTVAAIGAFAVGEPAEGALVLALFGVGERLEEMASERSARSVRQLLDLVPKTARKKLGDQWVDVPADALSPGDVVLVRPGEGIPADGMILRGRSSVNEANMTGEALPVDKDPGDAVFAGTLNGEGALEIVVTNPGGRSEIRRLAELVKRFSAEKAPSQKIVDSFARFWTPAMLAGALVLSTVPPLAFGLPWRPWIYRALTLLIVSCPCALVVSTPATVVSAIARAARYGVLIKGGKHLETLGKVSAVAFDKTGTLTTGEVRVSEVAPAEGYSASEVLEAAASVECLSEHPLARAVVRESDSRGISYVAGEEFLAVRGRGVRARMRGRVVYVGNEQFLLEEAGLVVPRDLRERALWLKADGRTTVFIGDEERVLGLIAFSDSVRSEARQALAQLKKRGVRRVVMLTGDDEQTAGSVARETGVDHYRSGLLPEEKVRAIAELRRDYGRVAMVGDGVNDAPSLAAADVGIAMGSKGSDISMEASDVVLVEDDLTRIPWALGLAQEARGLVLQNVALSLGIKAVSVFLVLLGLLPLWVAVMADSGTALLVTLNGMRILRYPN